MVLQTGGLLLDMEQWVKKVADLNIRCGWCRSIARRSIRGEFLTYQEQQHLEQHVTAVLEAASEQPPAGDTMQHLPRTPKRGGQTG